MAGAGLWWGRFAIFTFVYLKEKHPNNSIPQRFAGMNRVKAYILIGIGRTLPTAKKTARFQTSPSVSFRFYDI